MKRQVLPLLSCALAICVVACGPRKDTGDAKARTFQAALSRDLPPGSSYEKVERYLKAHHVPYNRDLLDNRINLTIRRETPSLGGVFHHYENLNVAIDFDHQGVEKQVRVTPRIQGFKVNIPL